MENVETQGRCCQCGICQVVCNNIKLIYVSSKEQKGEKQNRDFTPVSKNPERCKKCKTKFCLRVCPAYNREVASDYVKRFQTELVKNIFAGHTLDKKLQQKAASGGFITGFIEYLLKEDHLAGAILASQDPKDARFGTYSFYSKEDNPQKAASSIYSVVPLQEDLCREIRKLKDKKMAFVGRPCQIQALNRAAKILPRLDETIVLKISVFCAWSISQTGVEYLTQMCGIKKNNKILGMNYRTGKWPGNYTIKTERGILNYPFHNPNHFKGVYYYPTLTAFIPKECTRCSDVLANEADIAVGDAWYLGLTPNPYGYSLVVSRTEKAQKFLNDGDFLDRYFKIDKQCSVEDLQTSQGYTVKIKKTGVLNPEKKIKKFDDKKLFKFSICNKLIKLMIRLKFERNFLKFFFGMYLKAVWPKSAQTAKTNKTKEII